MYYMNFVYEYSDKIIRCDNGLVVMIAAFQAVEPGSIPGCRNFFQQNYIYKKKSNGYKKREKAKI